jgi:hypothetical protein
MLFFIMKRRYDTSARFLLGNNGRIWVDNSALQWVCAERAECPDSKNASFEKMNNVTLVLRARGNYFTTKGVLGEVLDNLNYFVEFRDGIDKALSRRQRYYYPKKSSPVPATKEMLKIYSNRADIVKKTVLLLTDGRDLYFPKESQICSSRVWDYIEGIVAKRGINVLDVDKGLVAGAISAGDGNIMFSADRGLIELFERSVSHFHLKDCFVSDSMIRSTYVVLAKKRGCRSC